MVYGMRYDQVDLCVICFYLQSGVTRFGFVSLFWFHIFSFIISVKFSNGSSKKLCALCCNTFICILSRGYQVNR